MVSQEDIERLRELLARPAQNIVIVSHTNPDGDAVGSSLAWREALLEMGHRVTCIVPNKYPYFLDWMTGIENLVLFKTDEAGVARRAVEESDLIFFLDFNAVSRLEGLSEVIESNTTARRILIDHHLSPGPGFDLMFSCTGSSSTSFLIYRILEKMLGTQAITRSMAESLYVGMMTDTGNFSFSFLTPELYRAVAVLVETGIDIPNANTIIVNNAQNFGLSDLHQLRGRVGRGSQRGYCYLLSPGDELLTPDARRRLRAIEEFSDLGSGFNIAMQDLDIRGAGNLLGAEQSGFIADIGFETYQKIMQEAIAELRSEGLEMPGMSDAEQGVVDKMSYISDSVIEIDVEAELPDSYVQQPAEKLRLYRELDTARNEEMLKSFEAKMIDRFGPLPRPAAELLNVVRLRWEAVRLGMERVKVKNGLMIVHFVGDDDSPYYKSDTFMELLRKVTQRPDRFVLKQHNNRLAMTVRGIKDVAAGYEVLKSL